MTEPFTNLEWRRIEEAAHFAEELLGRFDALRQDNNEYTRRNVRETMVRMGVTWPLWEESRADKPIDLEVA